MTETLDKRIQILEHNLQAHKLQIAKMQDDLSKLAFAISKNQIELHNIKGLTSTKPLFGGVASQ